MGAQSLCLIHSPLVGPSTWAPVAAALRGRGHTVILPELPAGVDGSPYWQQHAAAPAAALASWIGDGGPVLVGHSGAGLLLPATRCLWSRQVAGYVFVDAGIPRDGKSRLDLLAEEMGADAAAALHAALQHGERFPQWTDEELQEDLPDPVERQQLVAALRPQGLAFFTEPIPVFAAWPDAPCAYLQFSPAYDGPARSAREQGWAYRLEPGGHFHMLVRPDVVADALLSLTERWA